MNPLAIRKSATVNRTTEKVLNLLTGFACSSIVLFFTYYVFNYSVNFPFQDDNSLLQTVDELKKGLGWQHNLYTFFRAENDHRIFFPRLVGYLDYLFFGSLHFKSYILLSLLNLLIILGFVYRLFRQSGLPFYFFVPVPFLILQPQYHEVSIWALTGLQHISLLLFLSLCLVLLKQPSWPKVAIAVIIALLATFTHGNGILVFATGGFLLLIERNYKILAIWILFMFAGLGLYVLNYVPGSGVKSSINWAYLPATFVAKVGAILSIWPTFSITGSIVWGSIICFFVVPVLGVSLINSLRSSQSRLPISPELLAYFCFIFLTIGLITVFRSSPEIVLENRFKIYAAFSAAFFYLFLLALFPKWRKSVFVFFSGLSVLFSVNSFYQYTPEVVNKHSRLVADTYNWPEQQTELCNVSSIETSLYFLVPAYQQGYWKVTNQVSGFDQLLKSSLSQKTDKPVSFRMQSVLQNPGNLPQLLVETDDFPLRRQGLRDNLLVVLHDETQQRTYLAGTLPKAAGWRQLLTSATYFGTGFSTLVPLQAVQPGNYRLGCLLTKADHSMELVMSPQSVAINP